MTVQTGTATTAELAALYVATAKLEVVLRAYNQGDATGGASNRKSGRFTEAEVDAAIADVSAAITAVNA